MSEVRSSKIPRLVTSTATLKILEDGISVFGDVADVFEETIVASDGANITFTINVRRQFLPGNYRMHILAVHPLRNRKVAILCGEEVDPIKIHNLLHSSNVGRDFRQTNYINRYDWMHYTNWGSVNNSFAEQGKSFLNNLRLIFGREEVRNLNFFVDAKKIDVIISGDYLILQQNEWVYSMKESRSGAHGTTQSTETVIGFILHTKTSNPLIAGDWHYGCVLVDRNSNKCFAYVFQDEYTRIASSHPESGTVDIEAVEYTYNWQDFRYTN